MVDQDIDDATLARLLAEAKAFEAAGAEPEASADAAEEMSATAVPAAPLPLQLLEDLRAAEERQEAAERADDGRLRLNMAMRIVPPNQDIDVTMVVMSLINAGKVDAPMGEGALVLEGLNAEQEVIWTLPIQSRGESLAAGEDWAWAYPIPEEDLPPQAVTHSRLRYHSAVTAARPWPKP